ncbi:MAG: SAM-dependent chlorinase/fluorinase [Bryobacteraceae bacterium]|jgi:S-adenosylmethionine hydrolase
MRHPVISLTTDFGTTGHYAGVMKAVILGIAPGARIVDVSHHVRPFDVTDGAYVIAQAARWFPPKSIHVVVVDPGVGSARRPILAEAGGQFFVAPDNGVLSMVFETHLPSHDREGVVRHITAGRYFLHPLSSTFHGRDIFAPVAAHIAAGVPPSRFGKRIHDHLRLDFFRPRRTGKRVWTGLVLHVDRFGNLVTNFRIDEFPDVSTRPFELNVGLEKLSGLALTFAEAQPGELLVIVGSSGYLEVVANQASAAKRLGCGAGAPVELVLY